MLRGGYNLGGEQSGHIVFLDHNTTGDGLVTALAVLALVVETGQPLSELRQVMQRFPQVLLNVPVAQQAATSTTRADGRRGDRARRADARRARPRPRALLGHRAAAPRHDRGRARASSIRGWRTTSRRPRAPRSAPEARRAVIVVTAAEMRALDRWTIEHGTPGPALMERAGAGATRVLRARLAAPRRTGRGRLRASGNNGGDGFVVARHLRARPRSASRSGSSAAPTTCGATRRRMLARWRGRA